MAKLINGGEAISPTPEDAEVEEVVVNPNLVEAAVWRLGPGGHLLNSVYEQDASWLAESEPKSIYFYADLNRNEDLTHSDETMQKVYRALADQNLNEGQIINAVSAMQNAGIFFREREI